MTYPTTTGCVGTIAWEAFRETIDDVRYVTLLLDYVAQTEPHADTKKSSDEIRTWLDQLDLDRNFDDVRADIVEKILMLKRS